MHTHTQSEIRIRVYSTNMKVTYTITYIQTYGDTQTYVFFSRHCMLQCHSFQEGRLTGCSSLVASSCALWTKEDFAGSLGACCLVLAGRALYTKSVSGSRVNSFHIKPVSCCSSTQHSAHSAEMLQDLPCIDCCVSSAASAYQTSQHRGQQNQKGNSRKNLPMCGVDHNHTRRCMHHMPAGMACVIIVEIQSCKMHESEKARRDPNMLGIPVLFA